MGANTILNSIFVNNTAKNDGGAVANLGTVNIDCCIFVNFHWPILSLYHTTYALSISLVGPPLL